MTNNKKRGGTKTTTKLSLSQKTTPCCQREWTDLIAKEGKNNRATIPDVNYCFFSLTNCNYWVNVLCLLFVHLANRGLNKWYDSMGLKQRTKNWTFFNAWGNATYGWLSTTIYCALSNKQHLYIKINSTSNKCVWSSVKLVSPTVKVTWM